MANPELQPTKNTSVDPLRQPSQGDGGDMYFDLQSDEVRDREENGLLLNPTFANEKIKFNHPLTFDGIAMLMRAGVEVKKLHENKPTEPEIPETNGKGITVFTSRELKTIHPVTSTKRFKRSAA